MVPGATVTHVSYVTLNGAAITAASAPSGDLCVNGVAVAPLVVTQRADLGYLLQASLPISAALGSTVSMRYTAVTDQPLDKVVFLGQVLDPTATMHPIVRSVFNFLVNGITSAPDTISAVLNVNGADTTAVALQNLGGGMYQASVPTPAPQNNYELIISATKDGSPVNQSARVVGVTEANPEQVVTVQTSTGEDPTSLRYGVERGLRIAHRGRPTLRVGR